MKLSTTKNPFRYALFLSLIANSVMVLGIFDWLKGKNSKENLSANKKDVKGPNRAFSSSTTNVSSEFNYKNSPTYDIPLAKTKKKNLSDDSINSFFKTCSVDNPIYDSLPDRSLSKTSSFSTPNLLYIESANKEDNATPPPLPPRNKPNIYEEIDEVSLSSPKSSNKPAHGLPGKQETDNKSIDKSIDSQAQEPSTSSNFTPIALKKSRLYKKNPQAIRRKPIKVLSPSLPSS
ncbi:hypothetical protein NECID01_0308 [Nematocida sp. AWRm77]|nr:hypothetical protein NECID01_0308 [Nematocida sp. AWRm77]